MQMSIVIAQVPVVWDVDANLIAVREVIDETRPGDVVVLPEGMLSGYGEDLTPLTALPPDVIRNAVAEVARLARKHQVQIFSGSLLPWQDGWCNAGIFFPAAGEPEVYRKVNLAMNERGLLSRGDSPPTVEVAQPNGNVTVGMQLCREIRFPEQWQYLATAGARVFVYLTNAANRRELDGVWRSHLISRAAENQRFLAAANICHRDQHCPSLVISPRGEVLAELPAGRPGMLRQTINTEEAADWYLGQRRQDVIALAYRPDYLPAARTSLP
ncbi:carbon-nitrogen hydrolase family protein [Actinoplanes sp. Pm04-4]|uniref:Carbon-nitrogen hydrolase family protein n=1 Tax=Paractinoplanes pyxinae TaxID=2997416 RepID=A0ABT4B2A2_9ACTN|nr:nitrilase-related carbon-nitrogen hydrolase [Actinoplanes pyxinae]MCY1140202.1 carbon-nitrogen hydrolase family protein [Actinoplanes pyxinae]